MTKGSWMTTSTGETGVVPYAAASTPENGKPGGWRVGGAGVEGVEGGGEGTVGFHKLGTGGMREAR